MQNLFRVYMKTLRELYRIGLGPSSSHTMGPSYAAKNFLKKAPSAHKYRVTLYGSLAATGKGHLTDEVLLKEFSPRACEIVWQNEQELPLHPNGMKFEAIDIGESDGFESQEKVSASWVVYSVGGGALLDELKKTESEPIYPFASMSEILYGCDREGKMIWNYVEEYEDKEIWNYLLKVWQVMQESVQRGLQAEGPLPGGLHLMRKASLYFARVSLNHGFLEKSGLLFAYALAVAEENASGHEIVTAPTCGSSGVLPAVLFYLKNFLDADDTKILRALATASLIGNLAKANASISGAEVGCQGEVGVACSMAAAAAAQLMGGTPHQVEYAAEMGLEHHLGLTCDPIGGFVQVPCIERNAIAAVRALDAASFVLLSDGRHLVSFDEVVETMAQTGHDLKRRYRETSEGGLAYFHELYLKKAKIEKKIKKNSPKSQL